MTGLAALEASTWYLLGGRENPVTADMTSQSNSWSSWPGAL